MLCAKSLRNNEFQILSKLIDHSNHSEIRFVICRSRPSGCHYDYGYYYFIIRLLVDAISESTIRLIHSGRTITKMD